MFQLIVYRNKKLETDVPPERISEILEHNDQLLWLDLEQPSRHELELLREEFGFHPLAMDDLIHRQRPKVDIYPGYFFLVFYALDYSPGPPQKFIETYDSLHDPEFLPYIQNGTGSVESADTATLPQTDVSCPDPGEMPAYLQVDPGRAHTGSSDVATMPAKAQQVQTVQASPQARTSIDRDLNKITNNTNNTNNTSVTNDTNDSDGNEDCFRLYTYELNLFIGKNYIVSVHTDPIPGLIDTRRRWMKQPDMVSQSNAGMLLYTILDSVVDDYFPILDKIEERIEGVEEKLFMKFNTQLLQEILTLKKDMLSLRKVVAPQREVINTLLRREEPILSTETYPFISDVYDHILRIIDMADTYRDLISGTMDGYLSITSNNLNSIMKVLTSTSIILMILSLIAGIYGMNFKNMPELNWQYGYFAVLVAMAIITAILFMLFRRRDWL